MECGEQDMSPERDFFFSFNSLSEFVTATGITHGNRMTLSLEPFLVKAGSSVSCIHVDVLVSF